jgi:iron complex outermembrane recepter protein
MKSCELREALKSTVTLGALSIGALVVFPAQAQSADSAPEIGPAALEEVIVTARKREESLQQVPVTVSALTGAQLEASGLKSMSQLTQTVPGIYMTSFGTGQPLVAMRGNVNRLVGTPGVGFYTDGVFTANSSQFGHGPVDVARVEVLHGPQGSVYGRNTIAGAINLITNDPTSSFEGKVAAGYGGSSQSGDELWHTHALISGPLTDSLEGRVVYERSRRDGYLHDPTSGVRLGSSGADYVRGKLKWTPTDTTTIRFTAEYEESSAPRYEAFFYFPGGVHPFLGAVPPGQAVTTWHPGVSGPFYEIRAKAGRNPFTESTMARGYLEVAQETPIGVLTSITSYADSKFELSQDADVTQYDIVDIFIDRDIKTISQELRLAGSAESWNWLAGLYYLHDEAIDVTTQTFYPLSRFYQGGLAEQITDNDETTQSYAVFGQAGYEITPQLALTLGARWSQDDKEAPLFGSLQAPSGAINAIYVNREASWSSTTYSASLNYDWTDHIMTYVSYGTGFKAGGFQQAVNLSVASTYYSPEKVAQTEMGLKSELWQGRARLNLAAYHLKYEDLQVNNLRFFGTTPIQLIQNAAGAKVIGADVEFKVRLTDAFTFSLADTYLATAKIEGFSSLGGFPSIENFRMPRSPKNSITASLDFEQVLANDFTLKLGSSYAYRTEFVNELDAVRKPDGSYSTIPLPGYGLLGLTGELSRGPWDASLYVRNVTDKEYWTAGTNSGGGRNFPFVTWGEPRTWELSLTYHFE